MRCTARPHNGTTRQRVEQGVQLLSVVTVLAQRGLGVHRLQTGQRVGFADRQVDEEERVPVAQQIGLSTSRVQAHRHLGPSAPDIRRMLDRPGPQGTGHHRQEHVVDRDARCRRPGRSDAGRRASRWPPQPGGAGRSVPRTTTVPGGACPPSPRWTGAGGPSSPHPASGFAIATPARRTLDDPPDGTPPAETVDQQLGGCRRRTGYPLRLPLGHRVLGPQQRGRPACGPSCRRPCSGGSTR